MPESGTRPSADAHLDADALTDLVLGLAAEDAVARAIAHARDCSLCETRMREAVGDLESFRARSVALLDVAAAPEGSAAPGPVTPQGRSFALRWAVPLAAAAALVAVVLTRPPGGMRPREASPYWIAEATDVQVLRDAHRDDADSTFWAGLVAYESRDADRARSLLEAAHATGGLEELRRLYLSSSLLNAAHAEESLRLLGTLSPDDLPMPWRQDARWMTYRALLSLHRGAEADSLLDVMAAWPGKVGDLARAARAGHARR